MKTSAYTPFEVGNRDRVVGFFVLGAMLLFLIGFLIPFIHSFSADEGIPYYTVLDQTYGIAPNASVSMRGVVIGNVTNVAITDDAQVRVDLTLSTIYQEFYRHKSRLAVDTNIGVNTILTGSGLILTPGNDEQQVMPKGEFIPTESPQGLATLIEELDMVQITDQITEIISNVESITAGVSQNQQTMYNSLENIEQVTRNLAEVSQSLPAMVTSVDKTLSSLENTMSGLDKMIVATDKDMQLALKNVIALTEQATLTLEQTGTLFKATTPVMNQLPTVLTTTDVALQGVTQLTEQLSKSWLLGGSSNNSESLSTFSLPSSHPYDDTLYAEMYEEMHGTPSEATVMDP
jgi:phospholipid/cholesterol/gamma-HCH transport system substrate-binding protein